MSRGTIVIATELPFWQGMSGANQRISALCRFLYNERFTVVVYYPAWLKPKETTAFAERFPGIFLETPAPYLLAKRFVRRRWEGLTRPDTARQPATPGTRRLTEERRRGFERVCARVQPHAVIVEYAMFAYVVAGISRQAKRPQLFLDTHDVLSARTARMLAEGVTPGIQATAEEEAAIFDRFDSLIAIQPREAELIRGLAPSKRVVIAGHPHPIVPFTENRQHPVRLLFVGATAQHNRIALKGFLDKVWPRLWESHGDRVVLDIVGTIASKLDPGTLPKGVNLLGPVEDLKVAYREADVCINPAFVGSGLKIKNVEALCHGRPLVTTPVGAEGLEDAAPTGGMLVCESYEAVYRDLVKLIDDAAFRSTCACAAHAYATNHLTPEKVFGPLAAALEDAVPIGGAG